MTRLSFDAVMVTLYSIEFEKQDECLSTIDWDGTFDYISQLKYNLGLLIADILISLILGPVSKWLF